jgi:hypothetical protein
MPLIETPITQEATMIDANIAMLEIVVKEGRWYAYGDKTPSSEEAYSILVAQGGINDSVSDGTYSYTIERVDETTCLASLQPKEE